VPIWQLVRLLFLRVPIDINDTNLIHGAKFLYLENHSPR
jgi:hypothetical protein